MKKLLALSLALVMALGMTSVAFAAEATYYIGGDLTAAAGTADAYTLTTPVVVSPTGFRATDGILDPTKKVTSATAAVTPAWTVYYLLSTTAGVALTDADQVKGATIKQTWDMGKDYVESVSIVKKKYSTIGYFYFVAVTYKSSTSTTAYDIAGELTVKKTTTTTSSGATTGAPFTSTLTIGTPYTFSNATTMNIASESTKLYNFAKTGAIATQIAKDAEYASVYAATVGTDAVKDAAATAAALLITTGTSIIEGDQTITTDAGHYFDVDVTGQSKILLYYDEKYNATVAAVYPSANLDFVNFNGASFNKTGELTILADPDTFLYALNSDGSLSKIKAEYDEYEEAFKVTTRTLGKYVISDTELTLVAASSVASSSAVTSSTTTPVKTNPGTGAAA